MNDPTDGERQKLADEIEETITLQIEGEYTLAQREVIVAALRSSPTIGGEQETLAKIEAEARRYAAMFYPYSDGRNAFIVFAAWVAALSQPEEKGR